MEYIWESLPTEIKKPIIRDILAQFNAFKLHNTEGVCLGSGSLHNSVANHTYMLKFNFGGELSVNIKVKTQLGPDIHRIRTVFRNTAYIYNKDRWGWLED